MGEGGAEILLSFLGYSLCLLNFGINPNEILRLGKNLQNWENTDLFWIGKQPVFGCKIGEIKSLEGGGGDHQNGNIIFLSFHVMATLIFINRRHLILFIF